jgi:hypothetical protein
MTTDQVASRVPRGRVFPHAADRSVDRIEVHERQLTRCLRGLCDRAFRRDLQDFSYTSSRSEGDGSLDIQTDENDCLHFELQLRRFMIVAAASITVCTYARSDPDTRK